MYSILIVDNDKDIIDIFQETLTAAGHAVVTANCGLQALDILDSDQPLDLMLTDVVMPGLNGFNLARMARMRRPLLKILYLADGGETGEIIRDRGIRLGKLLTKPIPLQELTREVEDALATHTVSNSRSDALATSRSLQNSLPALMVSNWHRQSREDAPKSHPVPLGASFGDVIDSASAQTITAPSLPSTSLR
jgi:CheY-like chemotaxis protein